MARNRLNDLRRRVYQVLEQGSLGDGLSTWVDRALVVLIVVNLVAVALEFDPTVRGSLCDNIRAHRICFPAGVYCRVCPATVVVG